MTSRDALLRAAMHRVLARMGHSVADAAAGLAVLVQDAPDRVRQEWDLFQEEVKAEAERLDCESAQTLHIEYRLLIQQGYQLC